MTVTQSPLDSILYHVLATAVRDASGRHAIDAEGALAVPGTQDTVPCESLALAGRMLERSAQSTGPDALPFPGCNGGNSDMILQFTLPHDLGSLEIADFLDPTLRRRTFYVAWGAFAPHSGASAHTKLACAQWLDRFFQDVLP